MKNLTQEEIESTLKYLSESCNKYVEHNWCEPDYINDIFNISVLNDLILNPLTDIEFNKLLTIKSQVKVIKERFENALDVSNFLLEDRNSPEVYSKILNYALSPFTHDLFTNESDFWIDDYELENQKELELKMYSDPGHWSATFKVRSAKFHSYENLDLILSLTHNFISMVNWSKSEVLEGYRLNLQLENGLKINNNKKEKKVKL